MQKHIKVVRDYYRLSEGEYFPCMVCGGQAVDIHHVSKKSHHGKKTKNEQDKIDNLLLCCRSCHQKCEARQYSEEEQREFIKIYLGN